MNTFSDKGLIFPIWQDLGNSTHNIARLVSEKIHLPTSHTGTLDPMAEGVVIVLAGETRLQKYEYAHWLKEYEFEILFGVQTDTLDCLGKIISQDMPHGDLSLQNISQVCTTLVGDYEQEIPAYAAPSIKGKPAHYYATNNLLHTITLPKRIGKILSLDVLDIYSLPLNQIVENIFTKISKVEGNFRQAEICEGWKSFALTHSAITKVHIAKCKVVMTKGLYVRSLCRDIAQKLGTRGIAYSIVRTKNGEYDKSTCGTLADILNSPSYG